MDRIAIQPDSFRHRNGERQSFSDRWTELAARRGIEVRRVDVYAPDFIEQLAGCDGFMWRFGFPPRPRLFAKRLLPAIEQGLGIPVFPSSRAAWHFEDKIAQHYLLQAAGIPTPRTWIFWTPARALEFCRQASYPLVLKLATGFQSANVQMLRNARAATSRVHQLFGPGVTSLSGSRTRMALHRLRAIARLISGRQLAGGTQPEERQIGYVFLQEFLPGNEFDTRVTVISDRAFAFRRFNRPNDFRASGSGRIDWDPAQIALDAVRLAFQVARRLQTECIAVDVLRRGEEYVINEISYTFASWAVRDCPGHWVLNEGPGTGRLRWIEGQMAPEDAIFDDFIAKLPSRGA
ncbi:MAG: hypothetical protein H0U67_06260 [Gemmatimonadetes bacterium]|nr:hypothetical protein [Gemmatimonadota bacterium]